jgi:hypothetical protein
VLRGSSEGDGAQRPPCLGLPAGRGGGAAVFCLGNKKKKTLCDKEGKKKTLFSLTPRPLHHLDRGRRVLLPTAATAAALPTPAAAPALPRPRSRRSRRPAHQPRPQQGAPQQDGARVSRKRVARGRRGRQGGPAPRRAAGQQDAGVRVQAGGDAARPDQGRKLVFQGAVVFGFVFLTGRKGGLCERVRG